MPLFSGATPAHSVQVFLMVLPALDRAWMVTEARAAWGCSQYGSRLPRPPISVFQDPASLNSHRHHVHNIPWGMQVSPIVCGRERHKGTHSNDGVSNCRASWRLATTVGECKHTRTVFMMPTVYETHHAILKLGKMKVTEGRQLIQGPRLGG